MEKYFSSFIEKLTVKLKEPLPGQKAHQAMETLSAAYLPIKPTIKTRKSAVLMLFYPSKGQIYLPLILRSSYDGVHSGQIAFPGGRYEPTDGNLICTALREAQEEIGLKTANVKILGVLTEIYIAPSDFLVLPVVGYLPYKPDFLPNAREVEAIIETKFDYFSEPDSVWCSEILIPGDRVLTPHYQLKGHKVWGATAKMICELSVISSSDY